MVWSETLEIVAYQVWVNEKVVCVYVWGMVEEGAHSPSPLSMEKLWTLTDVSIVITHSDTISVRSKSL